MQCTQYPQPFKIGIITPVYKKSAKDEPNNYRKITITSIIGKTFEKIYLWRIRPPISRSQSQLQLGFTIGKSPMIAAMLMTEAITEADSNKNKLYIAFLDTKKAFDVVWHSSLLRRLYLLGIEGGLWLIAKSLYTDMKAQVKWQGHRSGTFNVQQGLLQGGITSAEFHKTYEDPLLHLLQNTATGFSIGSVYLGTITVCDDKTVLHEVKEGLQIGLDTCTDHANRERYQNGIAKSQVLVRGGGNEDMEYIWTINGEQLTVIDEYNHLGIKRTTKTNSIAKDVCKKMRATAYSLMGAGLHGVNGVDPPVSYKMWSTFVLARALYGLEALPIPKKDRVCIRNQEKRILKQIQSLPDSTCDGLAYLLLGAIPADIKIDQRRMGLIGTVMRAKDSVEYRLAQRQLATKDYKDKSWFAETNRLLLSYNLPSAHDILLEVPKKEHWKILVKKKIHDKVWPELKASVQSKSSARYVNLDACTPGVPHPVWATVNHTTSDLRKAIIKARLLVGAYLLQAHRARFNQHDNSTCLLCQQGAEDRKHFILTCRSLDAVRSPRMSALKQLFKTNGAQWQWCILYRDNDMLLQLILDSSNLKWLIGRKLAMLVEPLSRELCFDLHKFRTTLTARLDNRSAENITVLRRGYKKTQKEH
jgi:hypothetical protein